MKSALRQNHINCRNIFDKTLLKAEKDFNNKTIAPLTQGNFGISWQIYAPG